MWIVWSGLAWVITFAFIDGNGRLAFGAYAALVTIILGFFTWNASRARRASYGG